MSEAQIIELLREYRQRCVKHHEESIASGDNNRRRMYAHTSNILNEIITEIKDKARTTANQS